MARLDVRRVKGFAGVALVLELQAELQAEIHTAVVAPLISPMRLPPILEVNPLVDINGETLAVRLEQMISFPKSRLGAKAGNLLDQEYRIGRAVERLLFRS